MSCLAVSSLLIRFDVQTKLLGPMSCDYGSLSSAPSTATTTYQHDEAGKYAWLLLAASIFGLWPSSWALSEPVVPLFRAIDQNSTPSQEPRVWGAARWCRTAPGTALHAVAPYKHGVQDHAQGLTYRSEWKPAGRYSNKPYCSAQIVLIKRLRQSRTPKVELVSSVAGDEPQTFVCRAC